MRYQLSKMLLTCFKIVWYMIYDNTKMTYLIKADFLDFIPFAIDSRFRSKGIEISFFQYLSWCCYLHKIDWIPNEIAKHVTLWLSGFRFHQHFLHAFGNEFQEKLIWNTINLYGSVIFTKTSQHEVRRWLTEAENLFLLCLISSLRINSD